MMYTGLRLDNRLRLCALTSASRAISAVADFSLAEFLVFQSNCTSVVSNMQALV